MMREVTHLEQLIAQGKRIIKVLPRKKQRLVKLKRALSKVLDAKAKREASDKLDQQQALLNAIKKRESQMSSRLAGLKKSQSKLTKSVKKLRKVIAGKPKAAAAHRFASAELDSEQEAEIGAEVETEEASQQELDNEAEIEQEAADQTME